MVLDKDGKALYSWRVLILPYIEQDAVYKQWKMDESWDSPNNKKLSDMMVKVYQDDPAAPPSNQTRYRVFFGGGALFDAGKPGQKSSQSGTGFADITDGTSNTLHVTESSGRPNLFRLGRLVSPATASIRTNGGGWCRPASEIAFLLGTDASGTIAPGPCALNVTNGIDYIAAGGPASTFYGTDGTSQIYSFHPGVVNATFGDGSVRTVSSTISIRTLARIVTRDGGEVVGND